uniref:RNase H type-1 domain-containing protein n=1 Tax=Cannabis sativa TaxID=3483 RepID=A0A803QFF4_CANSA
MSFLASMKSCSNLKRKILMPKETEPPIREVVWGILAIVHNLESNFYGVASLGAVLINTVTGNWFLSSSKGNAGSILEAETAAILMAMQRARQCSWNDIHVLSDAKVVVGAFAAG